MKEPVLIKAPAAHLERVLNDAEPIQDFFNALSPHRRIEALILVSTEIFMNLHAIDTNKTKLGVYDYYAAAIRENIRRNLEANGEPT